jgi:hypothetical protein
VFLLLLLPLTLKWSTSQCLFIGADRLASWGEGANTQMKDGWPGKKNKRGPVETSLCFLPLIYRHTLEWSAW